MPGLTLPRKKLNENSLGKYVVDCDRCFINLSYIFLFIIFLTVLFFSLKSSCSFSRPIFCLDCFGF